MRKEAIQGVVTVVLAISFVICFVISGSEAQAASNGLKPVRIIHSLSGIIKVYNLRQVQALPHLRVERLPSLGRGKPGPYASFGGHNGGDTITGNVYLTFYYGFDGFICAYGAANAESNAPANIGLTDFLYADGNELTEDTNLGTDSVQVETGCYNAGSTALYQSYGEALGSFENGKEVYASGYVDGTPG